MARITRLLYTSCIEVLSVSTLAINSMGLSCLIFSHILPLATTEMLLVETYNEIMHAVAPKTKPKNETDQKSVGSNKENGHLKTRLEVGQDYHHGCWKCGWRLSFYCKWVVTRAHNLCHDNRQ